AACRLQIRSLLDVTSEAVVDMIIGKTPEEVNKMFNMKQDVTFEEIMLDKNLCIVIIIAKKLGCCQLQLQKLESPRRSNLNSDE
ncbi:SKP1-like protein 1B, partial [Tanacetum coccineum]